MRRCATILIICLAIVAIVGVHRARTSRSIRSVTIVTDHPFDVAATLRELTGKRDDPTDKGWALRFADFVNDHPGRQWVVGRCAKPSLSETEAVEQARQDAAAKVLPIVAQHLRVSRFDREWIEDRGLTCGLNGRLEAGRFAEQFNLPYREVCTESVLLDVSADSLDTLTADYRAELRAQHARTGKHFAAGAAVVLLTGLLYILLNIATKGYFTLRLRLAAAAIVTAVIVLLV
jgi:hypothetical protein